MVVNSDVIVNVPSFSFSAPQLLTPTTMPKQSPSPAPSLPEPNPSACPLQPKRRPCLPDQLPSPAQPPLPSFRLAASQQPPKAWQRICALTKRRNLFPISAALASYHREHAGSLEWWLEEKFKQESIFKQLNAPLTFKQSWSLSDLQSYFKHHWCISCLVQPPRINSNFIEVLQKQWLKKLAGVMEEFFIETS